MNCILAFDFDGVICDSATESAVSAWRACREIWPVRFAKPHPSSEFIKSFVRARPVILDCYELLFLSYLLAEGTSAESIITEIEFLLRERVPNELREMGRRTAAEHLGKARDEWVLRDKSAWLEANPFYQGISEILRECRRTSGVSLHIITKKQRRFVELLLEFNEIPWDSNFIFAEEDGSKVSCLKELMRQNSIATNVVFIEDRVATLEEIRTHSDLDSIALVAAAWGYATPEDCKRATILPNTRLFTLEECTVDNLLSRMALTA